MKRVTISVLDKDINTVTTIEATVEDNGELGYTTWDTPDWAKYPYLKDMVKAEASEAVKHAANYSECVLLPTKVTEQIKKQIGDSK